MTTLPRFMPGKELARRFYAEAVAPILREAFPGLRHSAALIYTGSEVLGFDDPRSRDHEWGPRVMLFLYERDLPNRAAIGETLERRLPTTVADYSTSFSQPNQGNIRVMEPAVPGRVRHRVVFMTRRSFFRKYLGYNSDRRPTVGEWLSFPQQRLATVRYGEVFHDGLGLEAVRERLRYYPDNVWKYLLACQWQRISQEEAFPGRCQEAGDELGSRIVTGRLVRDLMRLCFLMEREYIPFEKWLGTAFARLSCGPRLVPLFHRALAAKCWQERERWLSRAYTAVAARHNRLGITPAMITRVTNYYDRPYRVIHGERFVQAIHATIRDAKLRRRPVVGSVDQWVDSTDVLTNSGLTTKLESIFQTAGTRGTS